MAMADTPVAESHRLLSLARTKARLGRREQAVAHYDDALAYSPGYDEAFLEVVALFESEGAWAEIAQRCANWISHNPDHASHRLSDRVHNIRIDALGRLGGFELASQAYGLEQITNGPVELHDDDIVAVVTARNEAVRLPFLLEHHRRLGVSRFLVIDNGSDDGSLEFLLGEADTAVWRTTASYLHSNCGAAWADVLLRHHVTNQWCLIVDADELFVYPGYEDHGLRELVGRLGDEGATCYRALMVDMYGRGPLSHAVYHGGQDPMEVVPYFDRAYYRHRVPYGGPQRNITSYWGGVRARIMGGDLGGYLLSKVPLFRYSHGEVLMSGQHWLDRPTHEIAAGRGALLHFKYTAQFAAAVDEEVARKEHARGGSIYEHYARGLETTPDPVFFDPMHSVRYEGSEQLVAMGVMREASDDVRVAVSRDSVLIPDVPPVETSDERPFWSVVLVAGAVEGGTRARVIDVLTALDGAPASEVVIVGGPERPWDARVDQPSTPGTHALVVVPSDQYLTDVESANLGLSRTRGSWVHVVGPDSVAPDFYRVVGEAIAGEPAELAVTSGPFRNCTDLDFMVRSARFVARRHLYEQVGGFCATVSSAAPWEMLQRLAGAAATAPVSVPHACEVPGTGPAREFGDYGEAVIHWLAAIDLVRDVADLTATDVAALHDRCAIRAADLVRDNVTRRRFGSALATVGEALRVPVTDQAREQLTEAIVRTLR